MRPIVLTLAVGLASGLLQGCDSGDEKPLRNEPGSGPGSEPGSASEQEPVGSSGSGADCPAAPVHVEGSSATYRFERAGGTTEDVTTTVSAYSAADESVTFTLAGDGGAYSVTDDLGCHDTGNAPGRAANDVENDPIARALLTTFTGRFDEASTSTRGTSTAAGAPEDADPCRTATGSEASGPFAEREVIRCEKPGRLGSDGEATTVTTELVPGTGPRGEARLRPVVGVVFRERVRASGEVDRVRLIDWNGR